MTETMHEKKAKVLEAKSYTRIYDIFGSTPFSNVLYQNTKKNNDGNAVTQGQVGDFTTKNDMNEILCDNTRSLVTSEKYHHLNKELSSKSVFRSTSTIFYDLDDLAKRHSFTCLPETCTSNANILKVMKLPLCCGFKGKSNAIVQECATQIQPKLLAKDSIEITSKRQKKLYPHNDILSSEILLRDRHFGKNYRNNQYYNIDVTNRQKFWSYAKYRTEYTKPIPDEHKNRTKDRGKRIEDPCPCQLFSYACPCTDEKSLTELAKKSKCLQSTDQVTSTTKIIQDTKKKPKHETSRLHKLINTTSSHTKESLDAKNEPVVQVAQKQDIPLLIDNFQESSKIEPRKKSRKMICPNCKEKVEAISFTEDECSSKCISRFESKELSSTAAYNCNMSLRSNKNKNEDGDICFHEPRCELIPVCQILPNDDNFNSPKYSKKRVTPKSIPRVIRITKACRHHPPCTVVPSCQRANVLRNNCEFIPPCLHRPRCVNLPLCVPLAKSIHYDELGKLVNTEDSLECRHVPRCKLIPVCHHDSLTTSTEHHFNLSPCAQNECEYDNEFNPSTYIISPKSTLLPNKMSPGQISAPRSPCCSCRLNKSCQFSCYPCKVDKFATQDSSNANGIVYIRDVGCQFQSKFSSPQDSVLYSKRSSASLYCEKFFTNAHTLRYEDKCTNPIMNVDYVSTDSGMSIEIDSNCPSHGRYTKNQYSNGFRPKTAFVTAYANMSTRSPSMLTVKQQDSNKSDTTRHRDGYPLRRRRSFLKGKYYKFFSQKRRKSSTCYY